MPTCTCLLCFEVRAKQEAQRQVDVLADLLEDVKGWLPPEARQLVLKVLAEVRPVKLPEEVA